MMAESSGTPKTMAQRILRHWYAWLITMLFALGFLFADAPPRDNLFLAQENITRGLKLLLGLLYIIAAALPTVLGALIIGASLFSVIVLVRSLIQQQRWPTLIPVLILIGANMVLIGAPSFVLSRSVGERSIRCELFANDLTGLRVVRYPLDSMTDYAEQQFFLMTFDGGATWGQFARTFVYEPLIVRCNGVEFTDDLNGSIVVEHSIDRTTTEYLTYETTDGGRNWEITEHVQP